MNWISNDLARVFSSQQLWIDIFTGTEFFNNQKLNAPQLLEMVGEVLSERYNLKGIVRGTYSSSQHHSWSEWQEKGASQVDVAILTHGD